MRTRSKTYRFYGISKEDVKSVYKRIEVLDDDGLKMVEEVIKRNLPCYASKFITASIIHRIGYTELERTHGLLMLPEDFYGYKRKAIYAIYKWMEGEK